MSKYAKWDSIQEIREIGLKSAPAYMFEKNDWVGILEVVVKLNYCCGLRTDKADCSIGLPFYLPLEKSNNGELFWIAIKGMQDADIIIVQFSPNSVEHQVWDMVCYLTEYRELYGEFWCRYVSKGGEDFSSLRDSWRHGTLHRFSSRMREFNEIVGMRKVKGDLIKAGVYNRRVEVSYFPTLGHYYWQLGKYDEKATLYPPQTRAGWSSGSSTAS